MKKIHKQRLLMLSDMLDNHAELFPKTEFDLSTWVEGSEAQTDSDTQPYECGYAACAVGSALFWPPFIEQGFALDDYEPSFEDKRGWDAVMVFFGLRTIYHAYYLFSEDEYLDFNVEPTASNVARRIRKFVETGGVLPPEHGGENEL